jgi:hypothetical protein
VIPYATGLYFIDMNRLIDEAVEEALEFKHAGFQAIKMKIGLGDLKLDAKRVTAVREAIGPDVKLAVDANHCFSVPNAIKLGRMLEEQDILWFEVGTTTAGARRLAAADGLQQPVLILMSPHFLLSNLTLLKQNLNNGIITSPREHSPLPKMVESAVAGMHPVCLISMQ